MSTSCWQTLDPVSGFRRARPEPIGNGEDAPVLTVEDVIVHKLIAGRTQDIADIEAILAARVAFDASYVERWARFWEVLDRWRELRTLAR